LPLRSTPEVDRLLEELEADYRAMDVERFVGLFSEDVAQLDVTRRVHLTNRAAWIEQTRKINAAHRSMERRHRSAHRRATASLR
jgi:hypothetical protein